MEQRCCILVTDLNDAQFEEIDAELRSKLRATGHPDANRVNKVLKRSVPYELLKGRHRKETLDMQIFQKTRATTDAWWRCRVIDKSEPFPIFFVPFAMGQLSQFLYLQSLGKRTIRHEIFQIGRQHASSLLRRLLSNSMKRAVNQAGEIFLITVSQQRTKVLSIT